MRKYLITTLLTLLSLTSGLTQGIVKNFFRYSTFYTSFSQSNAMIVDDVYAVRDGVLTVVPMNLLPNHSFSVGLRKIARFGYENKAKNFYDGSESSMSDETNVGHVSGFEYVFQRSVIRVQGRESRNQRYFLRHLSKWVVAEVDYMEDGLADIKYLESALKLRVKVGKKLNL